MPSANGHILFFNYSTHFKQVSNVLWKINRDKYHVLTTYLLKCMGCPHTVTFKVKFAIFQMRVFLHYKGTHLSVLLQHFCRIYVTFHILFKRIYFGILYFIHIQPKHIFFLLKWPNFKNPCNLLYRFRL